MNISWEAASQAEGSIVEEVPEAGVDMVSSRRMRMPVRPE